MQGHSIAVIGNCQSVVLADCLSVMIPKASIGLGYSRDIRSGRTDLSELIKSCATLLVQTSMRRQVDAELARISVSRQILTYPAIYFTGFHPDLVYASAGGKNVESAFGSYNSAICLFGWMKGLDVDKVLSLFRDDVYRHLGYHQHVHLSRDSLLDLGRSCGLALDAAYEGWVRAGSFMHSVNHPKLPVMADIARAILAKAGIEPELAFPEYVLADSLVNKAVWPVYPEIGRALGIPGEYVWKNSDGGRRKSGQPLSTFGLREFVEKSFEAYAALDPTEVRCERFGDGSYEALLTMVDGARRPRRAANPYAGLPDHQFWKKAVATPAMPDVDPIVETRFKIGADTKVATSGSCFAQHIARTLQRTGLVYYVTEAGEGLPADQVAMRNYGVFSARYGNVYTARQLDQLFDRAYGRFEPEDRAWTRPDGRFVDPFRPQIEPDGFVSADAVEVERQTHFRAVRSMFESLDVFVFTLGLTEGWRSKRDGAVFPLAPGVAGGEMDAGRYEFVNFTARETEEDLASFLDKLRRVNPRAKAILTVSPVPLIATFEKRHVLVSTTSSKSALRVAAEEICRRHDFVDYFPSFEIITGAYNRGAYFEEDLRSVKEEGVAHVMRLFLKHYQAQPSEAATLAAPIAVGPTVETALRTAAVARGLAAELSAGREIVCDEERIVAGLD